MMRTQMQWQGDMIIVSFNGKLDFETHIPLREELSELLNTDSTPRAIIFNFKSLDFVGSSGISAFVRTLKEFNAVSRVKPRYCHVRSEFRRIMQAFDTDALFEFYEDEQDARNPSAQHLQDSSGSEHSDGASHSVDSVAPSTLDH